MLTPEPVRPPGGLRDRSRFLPIFRPTRLRTPVDHRLDQLGRTVGPQPDAGCAGGPGGRAITWVGQHAVYGGRHPSPPRWRRPAAVPAARDERRPTAAAHRRTAKSEWRPAGPRADRPTQLPAVRWPRPRRWTPR